MIAGYAGNKEKMRMTATVFPLFTSEITCPGLQVQMSLFFLVIVLPSIVDSQEPWMASQTMGFFIAPCDLTSPARETSTRSFRARFVQIFILADHPDAERAFLG